MTTRFLEFMEIVKKFENGDTGNGYVNNKDDPGRETVSGITCKNYSDLEIWKSLDKLDIVVKKACEPTRKEWEEIYKIYYENYYEPLEIEEFADEQLAIQVFDLGVNAGVDRSAKILQEVVKVNQDGTIGPKTLSAANSNKKASELFRPHRIKFYENLKQPNFINGWRDRTKK